MIDKHIRRTGNDYSLATLSLLPQGLAWPRNSTSALVKVTYGLAQIMGYVDGRAADLLEIETDPRKTTEMLDVWEHNWGLPDLCIPIPTSDEVLRRTTLVEKITLIGDQSRHYFITVAARHGQTVLIREYAPYMCGVSRTGNTKSALYGDDILNFRWQLGAPETRFYWTVTATALTASWAGADIHCLFMRWKPMHTDAIFDYSALQALIGRRPWNSGYAAIL